MTFVNMERIEKHFNNNVVLKDVSLQMNKGEIVLYYRSIWLW